MGKIVFAAAAMAALALAAGPARALDGDGLNAQGDAFTTFSGQKLVIRFGDLLDNDACHKPCQRPISFFTAFSTPETVGKVIIKNNRVIFKPAEGFSGDTRFKYTITAVECVKFANNGNCKKTRTVESTDVVHVKVAASAS